MRDLRAVIHGITTAVLCGMAVFSCSTISKAAGETYQTAVEAAYGDTFRGVYENYLAGSPLEAECPDGVDTASGRLMLSRTDLSLEGTGGMDLELNRYYDSNEANLGHATVEYLDKLEIDTVWVKYRTQDKKEHKILVNRALLSKHKKALKDLLVSYEVGEAHRNVKQDGEDAIETKTQRTKIVSREGHDVYGIASGWRYDLPWIETVTLAEEEGWGKNPAYLHYGSAGVIGIETSADAAAKTYAIQGLSGYSYEDLKLEDFKQTVDGISCTYLLRDKTGLRIYFNEDGVVVLQKDAHDNAITYTYTDAIHLAAITDSVGRKIVFHYEGEGDDKVLKTVTVQGKEAAGGVTKKTITYETEEKTYTPHHGDVLNGFVLTAATVDGSRETYTYRTVERMMNTSGAGIASQRVSTNQSYLLTKCKANGSETHYEYRACSLRGEKEVGTGQKRDVVTEQFYVTREYEKDNKTGKKSNGTKYDYFQKKGTDGLRSYDDFREREKDDKGNWKTAYEVWQYGNDGLRTVTVVSSFNPNKYKTNKKYYDYTYKKSQINPDTLRLKKDTKKNVSLYVYNENKLLTDEINYGKEKEENSYKYDKDENGSLVTLETSRFWGKKGSGAVTSKQGYTYDNYRNVLTEKSPKAYLAKNKGKEHLYTVTYAYHNTDAGYPADDRPFCLCILTKQELYDSAKTKIKLESKIASNGIDYSSISEQRSVGGAAYKTVSKTDFKYDAQGNETQGKVFPTYGSDGEKEIIQNDYTYNALGQQTKKDVTLDSAKNPSSNRTYTEEEITYDSFGNCLSTTDENGLVTKTSYDPETGEEKETIEAAGTEYESKDREYVSTDALKTMTLDEYGRAAIDIQDAFDNTIISKDEASGTWTENVYEYGAETGEEEDDPDLEQEENDRLLEKRTYAFKPDEKKFIVNEDGKTVPNFYITGRGNKVLSGSKYFYDDAGEEIGSASFSNGELDAAHCTSWNFTKEETEVIGEDDAAQTITISYSKELNPLVYQSEVDTDNYYDQFNDAVLSENITETVSDAEGNILSKTSTTIRGKNRSEVIATYETDDFGRNVKENTVTKKYQDGKWLPSYEEEVLLVYDENGNVSQTETKSRKEGDTDWQSRITKADYDDQGNIIKEYTPKGVGEGVSTQYTYDILGQMIRAEYPLEKEDGSIHYQTTTTEYDTTGNVIAQNEKIDADRTTRTEYTYDKRGSLVMVKNCMEDGKAQYVQYVYDIMGNKVRQFTGMTSPLTIVVSEVPGENGESSGEGAEAGNAATESEAGEKGEEADTFSYAGKTYRLTVSGKKKTDTIAETKYEYNEKNELVALIDPEGRRESYSYDENSNLTKTVDKNGNTLKNTYDYQNRLTEMVAKEKKTGKETTHSYTYNAYGDVGTQDGTRFTYGDVSGQVTSETTKLTKNKDVVKHYTYDSAGNRSAFTVAVGGEKKLSLRYAYDGESKLASVTDEKGRKVVGYTYDKDGNLSERKVPGNNLTTTYAYDYQNRLTRMKNQTGSAGVVSKYSSEYLENGQKSKEVSAVLGKDGKKRSSTATYTYDLLGHIRKETRTGSDDIIYSYDSNNNRKEMKAGNKTTAYRYNKNDELLRTDTLNTDTEEDSVVIYKNDKNGNQLATVNRYEIPSDKKDRTYIDIDVTLGDNRLNENVVNHYNALNQLTKTLTRDSKVSFTYDAEGLRTSKTVNREKTVFVWDGDEVVMELSGSGKVRKRYIRGNDLVYADQGDGTEQQYYIKNPHGDVVQLTDDSGKVIKDYEYDSFGNEVNPDKKDENPFRYCGEYYDRETETIYLRARYYQPYLGRFLTRDTYTGEEDDPLSLHLYTYCGNDGVNKADPSGNIFETILDIASIGHSIYTLVTEPSWENVANLAWDVGATIVPGVPGSYVGKAGKAISKVVKSSKAVQKGTKYARKAKTAVKTAVSSAKTVGKRVVKKSSKALKKRVNLKGKNLTRRTKNALNKAKKSWKKPGKKPVKKPTKKSDIPIYKRGESGEIALKKAYGGGHKTFNTSGGKRVVDVFANGIAHESKVGYVSKTQFIQKQIEKDVELVQTGKIKAAHWHFYRSPTTGKIGASRPLLKLLDDCNIKVTIHY